MPSQRGDHERGGGRHPLQLLALDAVRAAEAPDERGGGGDRGQRHQGEAHVLQREEQRAEPERVLDAAVVVQRARRERVAREQAQDRREHERARRPPAPRRQPAVGEQQQQRGDERDEPEHPDPVRDPQQRDRRLRRPRMRVERVHVPAVGEPGQGEGERRRAQQPADRVARPPRRQQRAECGEGDHHHAERQLRRAADRRALTRGQARAIVAEAEDDRHRGERRGDPGDAPCQPPHGSLLNHSETCAGWTVSRTTPRRSVPSASRSSSSRSRTPNASSVCAAS